jgi:hypothetical protein
MGKPASTKADPMKKNLQLGRREVSRPPEEAVLDAVPNSHSDSDIWCASLRRIHHAMPHHRPAGLRAFRDRLRAAGKSWSPSR